MRLRAVLSRLVPVLAVLSVGQVVGALWQTPDANIGLGLLVLLAAALVAGALGLRDGRRGPWQDVGALWLLVGGLVGLVFGTFATASAWLDEGGIRSGDLAPGVLGSVPLFLVLVAGSALTGAAIGSALRGRSGRRGPAQPA